MHYLWLHLMITSKYWKTTIFINLFLVLFCTKETACLHLFFLHQVMAVELEVKYWWRIFDSRRNENSFHTRHSPSISSTKWPRTFLFKFLIQHSSVYSPWHSSRAFGTNPSLCTTSPHTQDNEYKIYASSQPAGIHSLSVIHIFYLKQHSEGQI